MKQLFYFTAIALPFTLYGQEIPASKISFSAAAEFDLVFTEIMADPEPANTLPVQEFCEIYNRSTTIINLGGWTFFDGSIRALPAININPGEFVIICDDADTALFSIYGKCAYITSISLTNTGEKISIRDPLGNPVDSVSFSDSWYGNSYKKDGGWSLEKVDTDFTCPVSSNWQPSENPAGGTPGSASSVAGIILDDETPELLRGFCSDSLSVVLVFNEPLDPVTGLQLQHYELTQSPVPISVEFADASMQKIKLVVLSVINPGLIGTAIVTGVADCSGNVVEPGSSVRFGISDSMIYSGLIINEVLFNPFNDGFDFVECYHAGNGIIDLRNVKIETYDLETGETAETEPVADEPWLIFPGDLVVLTESPSTVASHYHSSYPHNFIQIENLPSMNVDEGHIALTSNGVVLDAFHYSEDNHFALLEDIKGISLEKINPGLPSSYADSWHSAAQTSGGATPGLKNSQYTDLTPGGDAVTLSPEIFSPDNDGRDDVVTVSIQTGTPGYLSNVRIYNSDGQIVFGNATNTLLATDDTFTWDGIADSGERAPVGDYVVFVEVFHLEGMVKKYRLPFVLAVKL